jgi:hypothetical protein
MAAIRFGLMSLLGQNGFGSVSLEPNKPKSGKSD